MNDYQYTACNEYLSWFPNNVPFERIIEMVEEGDDNEVAVWEVFEGIERKRVAAFIRGLAENLEEGFIPRNQEETGING